MAWAADNWKIILENASCQNLAAATQVSRFYLDIQTIPVLTCTSAIANPITGTSKN